MKKRFLSFATVLCLVLTLLPSAALAAKDDLTPPVVTGIYMNSPGATVTVGDTLYFDIAVEDESEIMGASLGFSPIDSSSNVATVFARLDSYDAESHIARVVLNITDSMPSTTWKMNYIDIEDYYGNDFMTSQSFGNVDFESVTFTVVGTTGDLTPPVVTSVSMENPDATVTVGDTLYFDIAVEDESEIKDVWLGFSPVDSSSNITTIFAFFDSYDAESHIARVALNITDSIPSATWKMTYIRIIDYYGNELTDSQSFDNVDFESLTFTVVGTTGDFTPPVVTSVSMENPDATVTVGDTLYFDIAVEDESEIKDVWLGFRPVDSNSSITTIFAFFDSYDAESHIARVALNITDSIPSATWKMSFIRIIDYYGNEFIDSQSFGNVDFESVTFTVASSSIPAISAALPEAVSIPVRTVQTITPTVTPENSIPKWTWTSDNTDVVDAAPSANGINIVLTAYAPGTATVTGTTQNGLTASCVVTVTDAPLPESGELEESYNVGVGGFVDIVPVLTPSDATAFFEVTSDNPHVASAKLTDNGTGIRVEGVNAGHATVTVRTSNGLVMTTAVTVGKETDTQHEKMTVPGREPTCTTSGWTDEVRCSACWYVFTESEEIPATGHSFGEWTVTREPTATLEGEKTRTCESCGYTEYESIPTVEPEPTEPEPTEPEPTEPETPTRPTRPTVPDLPTAPDTPDRDVTVEAGGRNLPATVTDGRVDVDVDETQVESMLEHAAQTGVVSVDASSAEGVSEVSLSQNLVSAAAGAEGVNALSVTTTQGSLEFGSRALDTLAAAVTGEQDTVSFTVDTIDPNTIPNTQRYPIASALKSAVFIELSACVVHRDSDGSVTSTQELHELGGEVTVSVPFDPDWSLDGRQIVACYIADDGSITYFPVRYKDGVVTFITTHFSTYGIVRSYAAAFADVNVSSWYMLSVEYTVEKGLMVGTSGTTFEPNGTTTRGMVAAILYRLYGSPAVSGSSEFSDVGEGVWYSDAITWASGNGIVAGYGDGRFGPDDPITREQFIAILWRCANMPTSAQSLSAFADADRVNDWAETAMRWAVEKGLISGRDDKLAPDSFATRAEAAAIFMRFCENILK